jgi:hypothetical protein
MKELGRFLRLERVRKDIEHDQPSAASRFATLEEAPAHSPVVPHSAPELERFRAEPAAELELERPDSSEPFVRCLHCGADSIRHATVCRQCEARLDSDDVRAYNARLWAEMTAARERENKELHELRGDATAAPIGTGDPTAVAELAARESARQALEARSGRAWSAAQGSNAGVAFPRILAAVALGLPLLVAFSRRGALGGWVALLVVLGAMALVVVRRWR